eukprot:Skav201713  [mRNA]  locus=scaffold311:161847:162134:+ [translate_table: standard]
MLTLQCDKTHCNISRQEKCSLSLTISSPQCMKPRLHGIVVLSLESCTPLLTGLSLPQLAVSSCKSVSCFVHSQGEKSTKVRKVGDCNSLKVPSRC